MGIVVTSCVFHGVLGKIKTESLIDEMVKNGYLIGKFWTITGVRIDKISVGKYHREILLACDLPKCARIGHKLSFIARARESDSQSEEILWHPVKIRFHGTSSFRFGISLFSVLLVLFMGIRYFGFDRKSFSLTAENGRM